MIRFKLEVLEDSYDNSSAVNIIFTEFGTIYTEDLS